MLPFLEEGRDKARWGMAPMSKAVIQQLSMSGGVFPGFEKAPKTSASGAQTFRAHLAQPLPETWGAVG